MRVNIVLPGRSAWVSGGFKVLYHYANGLAALGHQVRLVHHPFRPPDAGPVRRVTSWGSYWGCRAGLLNWHPRSWFDLDPAVEVSWTPGLDARGAVQPADATIASFWHDAHWLRRAPAQVGAKYYLIQEYEYYMAAPDQPKRLMEEALRSELIRLAISPAVQELVEGLGLEPPRPLPNGVEHDLYHVTRPLDDPGRCRVGFPTRPEAFKRTRDAIQVAINVKATFPDARFWTFGSEPCPGTPAWIEFHRRPSAERLRELYNSSQVFLVPSLYEGWGLPGAEAMACGAALVSTDNGGVRAYAEHGKTALFADPGDVGVLGKQVCDLLTDAASRLALAEAGRARISRFDWRSASERLHRILLGQPATDGEGWG